MELKKILSGIDNLKAKGSLDIDITSITSDSREVREGSLFIAIKGFETDGHKYIENAIKNGAKAIMVEEIEELKKLKSIDDITIIISLNTRYAMAISACNFYSNPSKKFKLVGITGTKGKTTTSFMIKKILEKQGKKVGLIGTVAIYIGDKKLEDSDRTTPESTKLQEIFSQMAEEKVDVVIIEVSSQSLKLDRVAGCDFDLGVFTNLSEDHISEKEHPDMEDYFNSKLKLFNMCKKAYINVDDVHGLRVLKSDTTSEKHTYGIDNSAELIAKDITVGNTAVDYKVKFNGKNERIKICIPGRFSVYNSLAAISVALELGATSENIIESLLEVRIPGRSELVDNEKNLAIMIDYAHSPESLQNILTAAKAYAKGKVICVFGCGGDRDPGKRKIMGEISGNLADYTIITSDNPRTEDPETIVKEIEEGIKRTNGKYVCIVDRKKAIRHAINNMAKRDLVILAGKGHEPYQEINHQKYPFDERTIVKEIVNQMK